MLCTLKLDSPCLKYKINTIPNTDKSTPIFWTVLDFSLRKIFPATNVITGKDEKINPASEAVEFTMPIAYNPKHKTG